jgi:hypothetical protein
MRLYHAVRARHDRNAAPLRPSAERRRRHGSAEQPRRDERVLEHLTRPALWSRVALFVCLFAFSTGLLQ